MSTTLATEPVAPVADAQVIHTVAPTYSAAPVTYSAAPVTYSAAPVTYAAAPAVTYHHEAAAAPMTYAAAPAVTYAAAPSGSVVMTHETPVESVHTVDASAVTYA